MLLEKKVNISEVSEFSILPYTQNRNLGNLGNFSFISNFDSCCKLRCKNNKKLTKTKNKKKNNKINNKKIKTKFSRFPSFQFCPIPKIEKSEIPESVLLF